MNKKQKKSLFKIIAAAVLFLAALPLKNLSFYPYAALLLISYLTVGWEILRRAAVNIAHGQVFDENFLMSVATIGAVATGEYPEAVFVMIFYQVGELFQSIAVGKSRRSIASLMEIRPDFARVLRDGSADETDPQQVAKGEIIEVRPGEKIPLDGVVTDGASNINTVALTGESMPRAAAVGDEVMSGCVNMTGLLQIRVTKEFSESTVSKILELVENSSARKSKSESFITRFAKIYTPVVVIAALLLAVIPPLFYGAGDIAVWKSWVYRAMSFLVVSCPCALVLSVPLSFFGGVGGASRRGVLVKGSNFFETLALCDTFVFDKTGTLTKGSFEVTGVRAVSVSESELLELAAACESASSHPIAQAICKKAACGKKPDSVEELAGLGVCAQVSGRKIYAGNAKLMQKIGVSPADMPGTVVHIAADGKYLGSISLEDGLKPNAAEAINELRRQGVKRIVMLTGDKKDAAISAAKKLGVDDCRYELLPADKVEIVEDLLEKSDGRLAFVGDGINDAPVLARADVGVAMGALGSDAAIEAADVVLFDDDPAKTAFAIRAARKTLAIVRQNIVFVLIVKLVILALVAFGAAGMWAAVFADVGVAVIAILNAMRAMQVK